MSQHFTPTTNYELMEGDCLKLLPTMAECSVDVVWTDPPYFLSNGGQTCKNGKRAKVNKGTWDESKGIEADHEFHRAWLSGCQRVLKLPSNAGHSNSGRRLPVVAFTGAYTGFEEQCCCV